MAETVIIRTIRAIKRMRLTVKITKAERNRRLINCLRAKREESIEKVSIGKSIIIQNLPLAVSEIKKEISPKKNIIHDSTQKSKDAPLSILSLNALFCSFEIRSSRISLLMQSV